MNLYVLPVIVSLIVIPSGPVQGEIIQRFDAIGNLASSPSRPPVPPPLRFRKYSVPEGLDLRKDVTYHFYPVFGKTFAEIVKSAEENRPVSKLKDQRQPSLLDWSLSWTYEYSHTTEYDEETDKIHCDIDIHDITLLYDITLTLPALTDDSALNRIEKDLWKNYVATMLESGHSRVRIIKDDMREVILKRMADITYLLLDADDAGSSDKAVERHVRQETARIGKEIVQQILQKLELHTGTSGAEAAASPSQGIPDRQK